MNARLLATRVALVADALADAGVEPRGITVYGDGMVSVIVEADDLQETVDRLGVEPMPGSDDDVAQGTYAEVDVLVAALAARAVAS